MGSQAFSTFSVIDAQGWLTGLLICIIAAHKILDRMGQASKRYRKPRKYDGSAALITKKKGAKMSVYAVIRLVGTSPTSWEDAAKGALEEAAKHLEDLRVAEVEQLDIRMQETNLIEYRARLRISFRYHPEKHRAVIWA